jgi:hypothetical protein
MMVSAVAVVIIFRGSGAETIEIRNYDEYIRDLPEEKRDLINAALYNTVSYYYGDKRNLRVTDAYIREGSLTRTNDEKTATYGNFIVDMKSVKQSYLVFYAWSSEAGVEPFPSADTVSCLAKDLLIYGDFGCQVESGFSPITEYLPYTDVDFEVSTRYDFRGGKLVVEVTRAFESDDYDDKARRAERITAVDEKVRQWFSKNQLEMEDYVIEYRERFYL